MLSKNKRNLNKKTRMDNNPINEKTDQTTTTIKLILLPSKQRYNRLNDYSFIKF